MKTLLLTTLMLCTQLAAAAETHVIKIDVPRNTNLTDAGITRAEVQADLQIWQLAGLSRLHGSAAWNVDTNSDAYQNAFATYLQLRSSPQFATLVQELQRNPRARVITREYAGK